MDVPFDIAVDFLPSISPRIDQGLEELTRGLPPITPELDAIVHRSAVMRETLARARRVAAFDYPVLILGESGTGKELLARAIHSASRRMDAPFVEVNCGAIPHDLFEAEFFGHVKGAFTGASSSREGHLAAADKGTLFLDEIGELPLPAQVKLLRFLQEGSFLPVGSSKSRRVDVRVVAATNRDLLRTVSKGQFREDLFHRLAFGVLSLPPLRDRRDDIGLLIDEILHQINLKCAQHVDWKDKKLSLGARNILIGYDWPGNVRELSSTLARAVMWSPGVTIEEENARNALFSLPEGQDDNTVLNRALGNGFSLPELMGVVASHYITRALAGSHGNKTRAAELLGLPSYQTLTNWMKKYRVAGAPEDME